MAFHDGLFQLGMDLDRGSSTAQTEEEQAFPAARTSSEDSKEDFFGDGLERRVAVDGESHDAGEVAFDGDGEF